MPSYSWICHACEKANVPGLIACEYCGCLALASVVQVELHKTGVMIDPLFELKWMGQIFFKVLAPILSIFATSVASVVIAMIVNETRCGSATESYISGTNDAAMGLFLLVAIVAPTIIYSSIVELRVAIKAMPWRFHVGLLTVPLVASALLMAVVAC